MDSILNGFFHHADLRPERVAIHLQGRDHSYGHLAGAARQIAQTLEGLSSPEAPFVGILAEGSLTAYAGILGTLLSGKGFAPVHPDFPFERQLMIIDAARIDVLIVGPETLDFIPALLSRGPKDLKIFYPFDDPSSDERRLRILKEHSRFHTLSPTIRSLSPSRNSTLFPGEEESLAYLLFTSGSTGAPKGVPITRKNLETYLCSMSVHLGLRPGDRVSQTFKLAFDLSIHDILLTLSSGATLYPLSKGDRLAPGRFICTQGLTHFFCVPTMAMTMHRFRQLKPESLPSLRHTLFCGEALPTRTAQQWALAAPNSILENLYGPTEATIAFTKHRINIASEKGQTVPLGSPLPGQSIRVLRPDLQVAAPGEVGELFLSGTQLTPGYWNAPGLTEERFLTFRGDSQRWYRTGDLASLDDQGCLHFHGRLDHQVQIGGHRVELDEVDHLLRRYCGHDLVITIAQEQGPDQPPRLVTFVASRSPLDTDALLQHCREMLPTYMVPSDLVILPELPTNTSGKIDRNALSIEVFEDGATS